MSEEFPIGTRVTCDDEPPDSPSVRGTVIQPTEQDLRDAQTHEYPPSPEHGDLLVQWDVDDEAYWESCRDLQKLNEPRRFVKGWRS